MKLIRHARELDRGSRPVGLAIGFFDGVHLGHRQVIRQAVADAREQEGLAVALTFDRHPKAVVAPDRVPPLIFSLPQKIRALSTLGLDATLLVTFDQQFSRKPAEEFVRELVVNFGHISSICVGSNFTFGYKRSGNVEVLKRLGEQLHFVVRGLAAVSLDNQAVSSTRVREAIQKGQLDLASQMLGAPYAFSSTILHGDHIGRQLGFPTANLDTTGRAVPPTGIYAGHGAVAGQVHRAVISIGYRPTLALPTPQLRLEAHLLDFDADLYGQELELTFLKKLRDEEKFPTLDALRAQIAQDVQAARRLFQPEP